MIDDSGVIVGIEHIPQLYSKSIENISKSHSDLLKNKKIVLVQGDGRYGCEDYAPYDCIHVGAGNLNLLNLIAAEEFPEKLVEQLAPGGRMMIPVGKVDSLQHIYFVDKDLKGNVEKTKILPVRYVPLTSKDQQLKEYK
jgi:protein-L-isoaspartate(D-aspartate) O-methyltransferase